MATVTEILRLDRGYLLGELQLPLVVLSGSSWYVCHNWQRA
jgi:hypothetical protein